MAFFPILRQALSDDQETGTACLNFSSVVTVGRQKYLTLPIYTAATYSRVHKQCIIYKPKLQLKKETKTMVKVKPGPSG